MVRGRGRIGGKQREKGSSVEEVGVDEEGARGKEDSIKLTC